MDLIDSWMLRFVRLLSFPVIVHGKRAIESEHLTSAVPISASVGLCKEKKIDYLHGALLHIL